MPTKIEEMLARAALGAEAREKSSCEREREDVRADVNVEGEQHNEGKPIAARRVERTRLLWAFAFQKREKEAAEISLRSQPPPKRDLSSFEERADIVMFR